MRTMYDGVTVGNIPAGATLIAPYVDGLYANAVATHQRFPTAVLVPITVFGRTKAKVVDIERGDCTPVSGVAAVKRGVAVSPYCNLSTLRDVLEQVIAQGVSRQVPIWTAHPTGKAHLCGSTCFAGLGLPFAPNVVATQHTWTPGYDVSLVAASWPGVDPAPVHHPVTNPFVVPDYTHHPINCQKNDFTVRAPVKWMQWALNVPADGQVGPVTRGHLLEWQKAHHLTADAICGPATGATLKPVHR